MGYFSDLALQGIRSKRKSSFLTFLVLLISFSFMIVVLSIVGSISRTNAEYRLNTYGEWSYAILPAADEDAAWLESQELVRDTGKAVLYGTVHTGSGDAGIGTSDSRFLEIGRVALEDGRFPEDETEIALEADTLSALGYDYTLGQEITVPIELSAGFQNASGSTAGTEMAPGTEAETGTEGILCSVERTFTLCGVVREFSSLWSVNGHDREQLLVSAFITPEAAAQIQEEARSLYGLEESGTGFISYTQLFLKADEECREELQSALSGRFSFGRELFRNNAAYPSVAEGESTDRFYICLMAVTSLAAVFSVFFLQMRDSFHSYAVLRSVGMTKNQLALLLTEETLFLVLPAVLLGIPLGAGLTALALRLLMYSGSAPIQVSIPAKSLALVIILWILCAVLCRLALFLAVARAPLTGAFQASAAKSKRYRRTTGIAIFLLTALFGVAAFFTRLEAVKPANLMKKWSLCPSYTILNSSESGRQTVSVSEARAIAQIPGISRVDGFGESQVSLSFDGMEETDVWMYAIDEDGWKETFDLADDIEAFHNGELVLLTLPDDGKDYGMPMDSKIHITLKSGDICLAEKETTASVRVMPDNVINRGLAHLYEPYTVICSEQFLQNLLGQMGPGQKWDKYTAGEEFGYNRVYACADLNSGYLSSDITVAEFCAENGLLLDNRRQMFLSLSQENLQELILILTSGSCIAVIALLLLVNLLRLEAEQEKKSFQILRTIGMSRKQMCLKVLRQSLGRSCLAALAGMAAYGGYSVVLEILDGAGVRDACSNVVDNLTYYGYTLPKLLLFAAACILIMFVLSMAAKTQVLKGKKEERFQ